ncbi:MAG: RNA polymerase sigma factor [bacterium]
MDWVAPHWSAMANLARRLGASDTWEDVLQDALTSAWRNRTRFVPERGSARNWLLAITADQARKSWRSAGRRRRRDAAFPEPGAQLAPGIDLDLERAIARLPHRQRVAVTLHYLMGLPVNDAAAVMGCSPGTVKSTLFEARRHLRSELGEEYR